MYCIQWRIIWKCQKFKHVRINTRFFINKFCFLGSPLKLILSEICSFFLILHKPALARSIHNLLVANVNGQLQVLRQEIPTGKHLERLTRFSILQNFYLDFSDIVFYWFSSYLSDCILEIFVDFLPVQPSDTGVL